MPLELIESLKIFAGAAAVLGGALLGTIYTFYFSKLWNSHRKDNNA